MDEEKIDTVNPLPNLDFKIMQGNSLLETFDGIKLFDDLAATKIRGQKSKVTDSSQEWVAPYREQLALELGGQDHFVNEFRRIQHLYFKASHKSEKERLKKNLENIENRLIEATLAGQEKDKEEARLLLNQYRHNHVKPYFLWRLNFAEVFLAHGGFDVIVANPPYIGHKGGQKALFKELRKSSLGMRFNNERMDLFYYFIHLGIDLCKNKGVLGFITTNYFPTADSATKLRSDLKTRTIIKRLINFNELKIFNSATGQHNLVTLLEKNSAKDRGGINCEIISANASGAASSDILSSVLCGGGRHASTSFVSQRNLFDGERNYIRVSPGQVQHKSDPNLVDRVLSKLKNNSQPLSHYCSLSQGIVTGLDRITRRHVIKFPHHSVNLGRGVFVIDKSESKEIGKSPLIKPWFKNSDIRKYCPSEKCDFYVIHVSAQTRLSDHPNTATHLSRFKDLIESRNYDSGELSKAKRLGAWWALSSSRWDFDFGLPKIVSPQRSYSNVFAYTESLWLASADVYFITSKSSLPLKYILAILNSRAYFFWLYYRGKRKGEMLELYLTPLSEIPVRLPKDHIIKAIVTLVDEILDMLKDHVETELPPRAQKIQDAIDKHVYNIFEFDDAEINLIESLNSQS